MDVGWMDGWMDGWMENVSTMHFMVIMVSDVPSYSTDRKHLHSIFITPVVEHWLERR